MKHSAVFGNYLNYFGTLAINAITVDSSKSHTQAFVVGREARSAVEIAKVATRPRCEIVYETISPRRYITVIVNAVHDTENFFPRNYMVVLRRHLRIVVQSNTDLPYGWTWIFHAGGRGSSAQTDTDLLCGFGLKMAENQKANFVHNNAEGKRKTSQGLFASSQ